MPTIRSEDAITFTLRRVRSRGACLFAGRHNGQCSFTLRPQLGGLAVPVMLMVMVVVVRVAVVRGGVMVRLVLERAGPRLRVRAERAHDVLRHRTERPRRRVVMAAMLLLRRALLLMLQLQLLLLLVLLLDGQLFAQPLGQIHRFVPGHGVARPDRDR